MLSKIEIYRAFASIGKLCMLFGMKSYLVLLAAIFSAIYLINPGAGFIELLPDNIPFIGNLDEATATAILLACARYFGFDIAKFFGRKGDKKEDSEVIDVK